MNFKIYYLTKTRSRAIKLKTELATFNILNVQVLVGRDFSELVKKSVAKDNQTYGLFVIEGTFIPLDMEEKVEECIAKINANWGKEHWLIIGNKGIDFFTNQDVCYLNEPSYRSIPTGSKYPHVAKYLDSNIFLLNMDNFKAKKIKLEHAKHNEYLAFNILLEGIGKGLIAGVDSTLYTRTHNVYKPNKLAQREIVRDFEKLMLNENISTTEGYLCSDKQNYNYLQPELKSNRKDLNNLILNKLKEIYADNEVNLNIIVRTTLRHIGQIHRLLDSIRIGIGHKSAKLNVHIYFGINNPVKNRWKEEVDALEKEYPDLDLNYIFENDFGIRKPRVGIIGKVLNKLEDTPNSFVWLVDDDDFVMIDLFRYGNIFLNENAVIIGDSIVFSEEWNEDETITFPQKSTLKLRFFARDFYSDLLGDNAIPVCSAVYPLKIIKQIFSEYNLIGDYSEDYAILLITSKYSDIRWTNFLFAGISHHGHNTVSESRQARWDFSYATFFSEISNRQVFPRVIAEYIKKTKNCNPATTIEFEIFEREFVYYSWLVLKKFNIKKKHIQPIINSLAVVSKGMKKLSRSFRRNRS